MKDQDRKFEKALARLANDAQPMRLDMPKIVAWQFFTVVQMACRHPKFKGAVRNQMEQVARIAMRDLSANDPDLRLLGEMGWLEQFDVEEKG